MKEEILLCFKKVLLIKMLVDPPPQSKIIPCQTHENNFIMCILFIYSF